MASDANETDRRFLDGAARVFRDRLPPGSRYSVFVDSTAPPGTPSNLTTSPHTAPSQFDLPAPENWDMSLSSTKRLARSVEFGSPQIGDMPPQPASIRAWIGARLVSIVRRALFWYTGQIRTFQATVADAAREQALAFQDIGAQQRHYRAQVTALLGRVAQLEREIRDISVGRENRLDSLEEAVREERRQSDAHSGRLLKLEELITAFEQARASLEKEFEQQFKIGTREIRQQVHDFKTDLLQQELRLKMFIAEGRRHPATESRPNAAVAAAAEMRHINDPLLVEHARSFRGTRADIRGRLAVYLPHAQDAFTATGGAPALDLACGRGEWLEALGAAAIPATGIDLNRDLVKQCGELGLDAVEGDIPQFLRALPDESRSIITAFHLLEHVSFQDLLEVIDQSLRMLRPGGIVIFETPNPRNLFVSSYNFYLDPTHRHPLPSELLSFVVEARGFCDPHVIPLSPYPDYFHLPSTECPAVQFINDHFYGSQDYGLVAHKP